MTQHEQGLDAGAMLLLVVDCMGWWEVGSNLLFPDVSRPLRMSLIS
jgi:hypothetical protein